MAVRMVKRMEYEAPRNEFFSKELLLPVFSVPKFSAAPAIKRPHARNVLRSPCHQTAPR